MFSVITAIAIAAGSEAVDGIRGRGASCSGGSCSVAQPVVKPEPVKVAKTWWVPSWTQVWMQISSYTAFNSWRLAEMSASIFILYDFVLIFS
jgi:hypothetical protein